ncbi:hypothetical protein RBU60_01090 [Mesonia sp. MT50]|uniref:Phenylalanyl-tRNA synthetase subunit alpha n=1 Tax=Mesonia profundi TaxID=3070998 RepID=A0ABU0ZXP5_9FLAO|nr:hypothetical protein [Mesonia profundi]MDQ7916154.1 hypothetical protein [Mesonia profundi]
MKKDIKITPVEGVYVAAVLEYNKDFQMDDWNVYVINENLYPIETVLIVSKGFEGKKITTTFRHNLKLLPAKSYAKVELLQPDLFEINNEFSVSFFSEKGFLHHNFLFPKRSIDEANRKELPIMKEKGILAQ